MTTFLLIRHAAHDLVGKALAGRRPGIRLNACGQREAQQLATRLRHLPLAAIYASPRERAQETAAPLAALLQKSVGIRAALDDIDFGAWTSRTFTELERDPQWPIWCQRRTAARPPEGEGIADVQQRIVGELAALSALHPDETIALFSHCDVIKAALAQHLAIHLDELERFEISPASVSVLLVAEGWSKVCRVNDTGDFLH
jgi:broad specificity phosphatase PhoE